MNDIRDEDRRDERDDYQPPQILRLGTLAELTQGGTNGGLDGVGQAGLSF